jgi:hypothetical protein
MSQTALATAIHPLWSLLEEYGQDPDPLFRRAGIDPALLKNPNARLPVHACNVESTPKMPFRQPSSTAGLRIGTRKSPSVRKGFARNARMEKRKSHVSCVVE